MLFRRKKKYRVELTEEMYQVLCDALIWKHNQLVQEGHWTDAVDDLLANIYKR